MPYKDREAALASRRRWYYRNREHAIDIVTERRRGIYAWLKELKGELKCTRCEENDPVTLDFHHTDPKKKDRTISAYAKNGYSRKRILKEIDKCEVLCSNCHRKEHARDR